MPRNDTTEEPLKSWQIARIEEDLAAAKAGAVIPAGKVFAEIAKRQGWNPFSTFSEWSSDADARAYHDL
jgi:hypothetical protein